MWLREFLYPVAIRNHDVLVWWLSHTGSWTLKSLGVGEEVRLIPILKRRYVNVAAPMLLGLLHLHDWNLSTEEASGKSDELTSSGMFGL